MKTLDEVIKALEVCTSGYCSHPKHGDCPYLDERYDCDTRQRKLDALHYLKEYRERLQNLQDMMERYDISVKNYEEAVENCRIAEQKYWRMTNNVEDMNPLTWAELRTMEGKPVWMEDDTGTKNYRGWAIVLNFIFDGTYLRYVCDDYSETCVVEEDIGKTWRAYRKERNESDR